MTNRYSNLAHNAMAKVKDSYPCELSRLANMPLADFSKLCPKTTDKTILERIKNVVDDVAARNLAQADLINNIKGLGNAALNVVKIAFPSLL